MRYSAPVFSSSFSRSYSAISNVLTPFYNSLGATCFHNYDHKTGAISKYQNAVFDLLDKLKNETDTHDPDQLIGLQRKIESLAYPYDDMKSIYQAAPQIIRLLIKNDEPTAREYLKNCGSMSIEELLIINDFRQHTIEGIIVHVLGSLFNSIEDSPAVRLSTLVDQLDRAVRTQARLLYEWKRRGGGVALCGEYPVDDHNRNIGVLLVEFLLERNLLKITNDLSISTEKVEIRKKNGKYYKKKASYVFCNFDIGILPIQLNLPMVCPPKDWRVINPAGGKPATLSDLTGGYLCEPVGDIYLFNRYKLLAARDRDKFNIILDDNYEQMCDTMNSLQKESFEINVVMLEYIKDNYKELVSRGLLMPKILASINIAAATVLLRDAYLKYADKGSLTYPGLLKKFLSDVQRARYESFILDVASAYAGYEFYLPAFVDFRGRIYRAGVLHFHERDLARSLIVFSRRTVNEALYKTPPKGDPKVPGIMYLAATAFHYQKFASYEEALQVGLKLDGITLDSDLMDFAADARDPFQFLSKVVTLRSSSSKVTESQLPITQDASASAYQIISYFMLDFELAKYTNLLPAKAKDDDAPRINDIYDFFVAELQEYFKGCEQRKIIKDYAFIISYVSPRLNRDLVKSLLMPLVYGKTAYSMADNLYNELNDLLNKKECLELASHIDAFFKKRFPHIVNLMALIQGIGWIVSASGLPVCYSTPMFTTVQDYMKSEGINIWIYDRNSRKRRQVTLRVPTPERDRRKTKAAIFANFIHQKDALIAFNMIKDVKERGIPIYTVHDNFITTMDFAQAMGETYIKILNNIPHPMAYINAFLVKNIYEVAHSPEDASNIDLNASFAVDELSVLLDNLPLPIEFQKTKLKTNLWNKRLREIYNAYFHYILSIRQTDSVKAECIKGSDDSSYYTRLDKYRRELAKWGNFPYCYSLHL